MKSAITTVIICAFAFFVDAKMIHVPEMQKSIAEALSAAANGDTILLAHGIHTQPELIQINKAVLIASAFIFSADQADIEKTRIRAATNEMAEWFELSAENTRVTGIRFIGNEEHTLHITAPYASVTHCQFIGGKDQLSITGGGGYIANCYFENAGDDAIDCDESISWTIEYNLIVNAHQDGIEVRLHDKEAPLTTHIFRYNEIIGSGESGIQLIDYQDNSYREFFIHNNLFLNCRGAGVSCMYQEKDNTDEVYRGSLMEEKAFVFNNTFAKCNYGLTISPGLFILNNIFINNATQGIERGVYVNDSNDQSRVDFCLFYNNPVHYDADIRMGQNIIVDKDPLLTDNYDLQAGSPCIDVGIDTYSQGTTTFKLPSSDYTGNNPDLGAKEYNGNLWAIRQLPVIDAGKDLLILAPVNQVRLKASLADLSVTQGNSLRLEWEKLSGPGDVIFSDGTRVETTAEFTHQGRYELLVKGFNNDNVLSDKLLVWVVKDFREQSARVGETADLSLEAEDYRYLVGSAEVMPHKGAAGKVIGVPEGKELWAYSAYQISTLSPATYYIWVRAARRSGDDGEIFVAFNNLSEEKTISLSSKNKLAESSWQRVIFDNIPEGSYTLRIRAAKPGVLWDKIFITTGANRQPAD